MVAVAVADDTRGAGHRVPTATGPVGAAAKPRDGGAQPGNRRAVPRDHAAAAENCESLYQVISRRHCALYFIEHCTLIARWMSDD